MNLIEIIYEMRTPPYYQFEIHTRIKVNQKE